MNFLDQFAAFLDEPNVKSSLSSPASEQGIQQVENALGVQARICGFKMPPSYRAFLLRYDGGNVDWAAEPEDDHEGAWIYIDFLSVGENENAKEWDRLMYHNDAKRAFMNHEIETYFPFEPLVIFATDGGGNFWAFDPRYRREDGEMPVRYCDHETGDIYAQAEDFAAFLLILAKQEFSYLELENPL